MDYLDTADVLRAIVRAVETVVIPTMTDDYARSQLWATTGVLGNIANELAQESGPDATPSIGDDLSALTASAGLQGSFADADGAATAAARVREDLEKVIGGHATLHYRRSVAGFAEKS